MSVGTVEWFSWSTGRGLISRDEGGPDLPVDRESVVPTEPIPLQAGQRVSFDVLPGLTGLEAGNVRRVRATDLAA